MQALGTIYEVAFKSRGRDAAAAFRHTNSAAAAAGGGSGGSGGGSTDGAVEHQLLQLQESGGVASGSASAAAAEEAAGMEAGRAARTTTTPTPGKKVPLRRNALVQEMLGVNAHKDSSSSSSSGSSNRAKGSGSDSGPGDGAAGRGAGRGAGRLSGGDARLSSPAPSPFAARYGAGLSPWRVVVRSRSQSQFDVGAASELSSLTDANEYQSASLASSLGPSLGPSPVRAFRPGSKLNPLGSLGTPRQQQQYEEEEGVGAPAAHGIREESGTGSSDSQSQSSGEQAAVVAAGAAAAAAAARGGAGLVVVVDDRGTGLAPGNAPLPSDGGRSIVTESDWRKWLDRDSGVGVGERRSNTHQSPRPGPRRTSLLSWRTPGRQQQQSQPQSLQQQQQQQQGQTASSFMSPRFSDAGRSIVTESDWRKWQRKEGEGETPRPSET
jgi:hypothetical protein